MARIKLALSGAAGRMGRSISELILNDEEFKNSFILVELDTKKKDRPNVVVDFSAPKASLEIAKICAAEKIPLLVGTTGFSADEFSKLESILKKTPWILAPNTSLGICALSEALKAAFKILPKDCDVTMIEIHHSQKKDAPSGTAKALEKVIASVSHRKEIPILSIRGGTEVGEHRIVILGGYERLEFVHRAQNRSLFAQGALRLAQRLVKLKVKSRPYTVEEVMLT